MTLTLRAIELDDAAEVHRIAAHPAVARNFWIGPGEVGLEGWKKRLRESSAERTSTIGAFEGGTLRAVAQLSGASRPRMRDQARIWMLIDPVARGSGVPRALLEAALDAADQWWAFTRTYVEVILDDPDVPTYQAAGFEVEAIKRGHVERNGTFENVLLLARLRPSMALGPPLSEAPDIAPKGPRIAPAAITIRPIRPDDAHELSALQGTRSVLEGTFNTPFQSTREWRIRLEQNDAANIRTLGAVVGGRLIASAALLPFGFARMSHVRSFGIAVHPDMQGRGVGRALMKAILELADRMKIARVELEVFEDNLRAQALYRQLGFEDEGLARCIGVRRGTHASALIMSRWRG